MKFETDKVNNKVNNITQRNIFFMLEILIQDEELNSLIDDCEILNYDLID